MNTEMLTLKVISPISLHQRRSSEQFASTLDYIPGSTLRGAVAELYLAGTPDHAQDELFRRLFLSGEVTFSDFFPCSGSGSDLPRLLPGTALACKRFEDHFITSLSDNLLRLELMREHELATSQADKDWSRCPTCLAMGLDGKRDRAEAGYYTSIGKFERYKLSRRMIAGTSIRRTTHTAAHSMLFSHEVIEESSAYPETGVYFRGVINLPGDLRQLLLDLLPIGQELSVGYGRSRGWGLVQAQSWSSPRTPTTTLQERWQALNDAASQLWSAYALQPVGQYFSLTLSSNLLLRNPVGQPVLGNLQPADLGLPGNLERCRCVIHPVLVHGWNALMGRPKQDHWAIGRGSVLLFRMPLEADASPVIARLEEIQQSGIGDRLCEGFGQMVACDPFHYHFIPRELKGATR